MNNFLKNATTGKTPFEVINGQKYHSSVDNLVQNKISLNEKIRLDVLHNAESVKQKQVDYYNSDKHVRTLIEGDWALVFNHYKNAHKSPSWTGPFKVVKFLDNGNYLIHNHLNDKFVKYNIQYLKKYIPNDLAPTDTSLLPPTSSPTPPSLDTSVPSVQKPSLPSSSPAAPPNLPLIKPDAPTLDLSVDPASTTPVDPLPKTPLRTKLPISSDPYLGRRVEVFWPSLKKWLPGTVDRVSDDQSKGTHEIAYDGEKHFDDPNTYEFLRGKNAARFRFTGEEYDDDYDDG